MQNKSLRTITGAYKTTNGMIVLVKSAEIWIQAVRRDRIVALPTDQDFVSQAEALWESKSQITGLACQDTRYKGPVYQTSRQNDNNNQSTHNFYTRERSRSRETVNYSRR
jgi:hypothetical protein